MKLNKAHTLLIVFVFLDFLMIQLHNFVDIVTRQTLHIVIMV